MRILFLFSAFFIQNLILGQVLPFVELTEDKNEVVLDIRYATSDNFTNTRLYDCGRCFLHPTVAKALQRAADDFKKQGYVIKEKGSATTVSKINVDDMSFTLNYPLEVEKQGKRYSLKSFYYVHDIPPFELKLIIHFSGLFF